ncbi:hypothetical protein [Rhodoplanes sp. SY1]|uniref:hypothetical protein n=1 Tax=Rhodoplanes sp. SY1 TaxID=3166646 RepID=UPI0038B62FE7
MRKSSTMAVAVVAAAAIVIGGFGPTPAVAASAGKAGPDLTNGTVEAGAQRRYHRGGRSYRGVPPGVPYAVGAAAATIIGIAAANAAARRSYYYAPYGYYGGPPPAYGYYGPGYAPYGYAPYGYYDRW